MMSWTMGIEYFSRCRAGNRHFRLDIKQEAVACAGIRGEGEHKHMFMPRAGAG